MTDPATAGAPPSERPARAVPAAPWVDRKYAFYFVRRLVRQFLADKCYDLAAALTFFSVLSLVPALVALVALLGLIGQAEESVDVAVQILEPLTTDDLLASIEPILIALSGSAGAGSAFTISVAVGLWSASAYVGAFSRAMNRVYGVEEGRPVWLHRPAMVLLTLVVVCLVATLLVMLVVTGPLARSIGEVVGLGPETVRLWEISKWPLAAVVSVVIVALLYQATPNVRLHRFRVLSVGAAFAILTWVLAAVGFGFYVANLSNYDATYGSLAGAVVSLVFLWISNMALLFGAEIDREVSRHRQLRTGLPAESRVFFTPRSSSRSGKLARQHREDIEYARAFREQTTASRDTAAGSTAARPAE